MVCWWRLGYRVALRSKVAGINCSCSRRTISRILMAIAGRGPLMVTVIVSVGNLFFSDWDAALSLADVVEASSVVKYTFDFLCGILMPLTRWSLVGKFYPLYQSLSIRVK